jgi:hypothetical protein
MGGGSRAVVDGAEPEVLSEADRPRGRRTAAPDSGTGAYNALFRLSHLEVAGDSGRVPTHSQSDRLEIHIGPPQSQRRPAVFMLASFP